MTRIQNAQTRHALDSARARQRAVNSEAISAISNKRARHIHCSTPNRTTVTGVRTETPPSFLSRSAQHQLRHTAFSSIKRGCARPATRHIRSEQRQHTALA